MKKILSAIAITFTAAALFTSCKKEANNTTSTSGTSTVQFRLTDGPGNFDAVLIDVQGIEVVHANGIQTLPILNTGIYNLLDFNNGLDTLLSTATLPAGNLSQIRLILGDNNSVVIDGISHQLETPSAQQSGLKLNVQQNLIAGKTYKMWIDFDAARSIVAKGNGGYALKPVIRTFTDLTNGRIEGYVLPTAANAVVWAINGSDTLSAIPNTNGYFQISGLSTASYQVVLDADAATNYQDSVINNVQVTFGNVTNIGTATLHP